MPALDQLLVYFIVAAAALYLARQYSWKKRGGCGGCEGCPTSAPEKPEEIRSELIQLEAAPPKRSSASNGH